MDWTTILKAQQADFIQRLEFNELLHCEKEVLHSELIVISGERLKQLRNFCWEMVKKYRPEDPKNYFVNNMKGKLGEEVVKTRLGEFVTEVDYEKRIGGDGKVDFTLTSDSFVGIQVKARCGHFDTVKWSISPEEIKKNDVLVCILIQEEVSEAETEYHLIIAGFLPTNMITETSGKGSVGINELLYCGGLRIYLESCKSVQPDYYIHQGDDCFARHDYQGAITNYNQELHLNSKDAKVYSKRANTYYEMGELQYAMKDYNQLLQINPNDADAYYRRGNTRYDLGNMQGAVEDYNQALCINPAHAEIYYKRGITRHCLGDNQGAIEDYTQVIQLDINYIDAYYKRAEICSKLGYKLAAIEDLTTIIEFYPEQVDACFMRGNIYYILGLYQDAICDYNLVIGILSTCTYAYFNRGLAYFYLGNNQASLEDFTYLIKLYPSDLNNYFYRGLARFNLGDKQGAIKDFSTIIAINSNDANAYFCRGNIYYNLEQISDAIKDYTQSIKIVPACANAYYNRGLANCDLGNKQGAIDDLKQAVYIYKQENNTKNYNETLERLKNLQHTEDEVDNKNLEGQSEKGYKTCQFPFNLNYNLPELDNITLTSAPGVQTKIPTTERLALALEELNDPRLEEIIDNARCGDYDDYLAKEPLPITRLVKELVDLGHHTLAERAIHGEFDPTEEEVNFYFWANFY